jgi:hypothetical protein
MKKKKIKICLPLTTKVNRLFLFALCCKLQNVVSCGRCVVSMPFILSYHNFMSVGGGFIMCGKGVTSVGVVVFL